MFLSQCNARENRAAFPRGKRAVIVRRYPDVLGFFFSPCVQCFRASVIHGTLTWTTGSLTCVRSNACMYTRGWGTAPASQHVFDLEKLSEIVRVLRTGFEPLVMESIEPPRTFPSLMCCTY